MNYRRKLFSVKDPYDTEGTEQLFARAAVENCFYHYRNCSEYKKILDGLGFDLRKTAGSGRSVAESIPFIPTVLFKRHKMFSMPRYKMPIIATSSGTSGGNISEIGFDFGSLLCGLNMVLKVGNRRKLFSPIPCNYILMGYKPHIGNRTAVTKTATGATLFTPCLSRTYVLKYKNGKYAPDFEGVMEAVKKCAQSCFPCRFMGFPAYTYFLLKIMEENGIRVKMPKGSKILLGGGWKQFYSEKADKETVYRLAKRILDIDEENIIEFFGAVEHPILYCDCKNHHFHIPAYSRVVIRDPVTLKPLKKGEVGLVNLITPMVKATPILSVMTDDLGVIRDNCGCGINSPYLEIIGRVAPDSLKTCAAGAEEIMKKIQL